MRVVALLLLLRAALGAEQCGDFVCFHNSKCAPGPPDFSSLPAIPEGGKAPAAASTVHCECTKFFTGVDCSIPVENCDDGRHKCFHGGICYMDDPDSLPYCDCSNAVDLSTGKKYVGQYCEQEQADSYCAHVENPNTFCLNGGVCNDNFPATSPYPCVCDGTGYKGSHCELPDNPAIRSCVLPCQNGGVCLLGEDKDKSPLDISLDNGQDAPDDHQHCECPEGYFGALCDQKPESKTCGEHQCLHGAECKEKQTSQGTVKYCDCSTIWDTTTSPPSKLYAGTYCQSPATSFCGEGNDGSVHFCANFEECADSDDPTAGCNCQGSWTGVHCEYNSEYDCTLDCGDHGTCKIGDPPADSPDYLLTLDANFHHDYQYCECDLGYSGSKCEVNANNVCGNLEFACLHGGECQKQDDGSYACNCLTAQSTDGSIYYDGKYCQYPSTSICMDDVEEDEIYFCTNMGQCQENFKDGCLCFDGFGGFSCEFANSDCTLECENGGECTLGSPPGESYLDAYWFNPDDYDNWQYCSCPIGYTGKHCETAVAGQEQCPGDFTCLNGGTCKNESGENMKTRCDCLEAETTDPTTGETTYFDGLYCQFPSTVTCGEEGDQVFFCTNGGTCDEDYANKPCHCPPGYGGFYCELVEGVDCTLECGEHGTCRLGAPPTGSHAHAYWYDPDAEEDYQYCECKDGAGGQYCDVFGEDCGDFTCLNGGKCNDEHGKPMADRCNCLEAWDEGVNGQPNTYYDGRFCQYASTVVCLETDDQSFFCMNDGSCPGKPGEAPCSCTTGYSGFSCEFIDGTDCTLDCGEDGECRLGNPPGTSHAHAYWFDPDAQGNYQYCECKNGAGGKMCDQKGEDCGLFTCLNGGSCVDPEGNPMVDRCNCIDAWEQGTGGSENIYYDGRYCQYPSTKVCLETNDESYFCMNNGVCSTDPANEPCICDDEYAGFMCEFLKGTDCNLQCGDHGSCRLGAPPGGSHAHAYWYDPDSQENYQYCECDAGFGGKYCEFEGQDCGEFTCLNGGKCNDDMPDRCDCLEAEELDGSGSIPNTYYEGRFCQYASTSVCAENDEGVFFCVNDGRCGKDALSSCSCPYGFSGHSCEFITGTDCTLECENGGTCRLGSPPGTDYLHAYWYAEDAEDNYQYCECPPGRAGKLCESSVVDCGDYNCLNGGRCTTPSGKNLGRCDCNDAFDATTDTYFDGLYCQFGSTEVCYESESESYFCMNGGLCQDDYTLGCICDEGYGGFYCEFQTNQDCTLDCMNGGECVLGTPPGTSMMDAYWNNEEKSGDYQYCKCPSGYSGERCQSRGNEKCGDDECQNGGTCISRTIQGKEVNHCDCRSADHNGKYYAGTYCQYESTEICLEEGNAAFFCVNNGNCKDDYRQGCQCPTRARGFSCEFLLGSDDPSETACTLDCNGNGTCRNGIKDITDLDNAVNSGHLSYTHDDFMHCVCNDGWTGIYCDHKKTECSGDHFCLHGSECVSGDQCDCSKADSLISEYFAGDNCEHVADVCTGSGTDGQPENYCANGGVCKSKIGSDNAPHPGCTCPDGFVGERCEFTRNKSTTKAVGEDSSISKSSGNGGGGGGGGGSLSGLGITAIVLSVCAVMAVVMFVVNGCVRRKRFRRRRDGETSGLIWANKGGYKDNAETINFSPHKAGYTEDYMASFANPSRDPMATALAPDTRDTDMIESDTSTGRLDSDDEPQVFIGPPTDEDGHILHSVDII